jgi:hypothetical protein
MKHIIAITLIVLTVVGCSTKQEQITGVILPTSKGHYLPYSNDGKPTGGWKLSKAMIKKAQPVILEYIKDSDKEIFENLDQYRCQYFGIIINGKKRIYCNFFWLTEDKKDWRTNPIVVDDGGNWYFQLVKQQSA